MKNQAIEKLVKAAKCSLALDMPFKEGMAILEENGFVYSDRFELPASEFVKNLQKEALHAAGE